MILKKTEFIEEISKRCLLKPEVIKYIYKMSADFIVEKLLEGEDVDIPTFGKFSVSCRSGGIYSNLFGENQEKSITECKYPNFKVGHYIKHAYKSAVMQ